MEKVDISKPEEIVAHAKKVQKEMDERVKKREAEQEEIKKKSNLVIK